MAAAANMMTASKPSIKAEQPNKNSIPEKKIHLSFSSSYNKATVESCDFQVLRAKFKVIRNPYEISSILMNSEVVCDSQLGLS